jgi:putative ABC transport system permease protein
VADPNRFYRLLLKLYPARFREEFAAPLERQFSDEYRETHGAGQRALFWLRTLADWAVTVPAERARELGQDLRYAARVYRRRAFATTLALSALALAIGATTGVFSVVNALLLRSLPFRDAERLVLEFRVIPRFDGDSASLDAWSHNSAYLEDATIYRPADMNLNTNAGTVRVKVAQTTARFFSVLGTEPAFGRAFAVEESVAGRDQVAVIGHGLWQQISGGDPRILGATIRLNGVPLTVIGVAPPGFDFPDHTAVWIPTGHDYQRIPNSTFGAPYTVGRLKPGVTVAEANRMYYAELALAYPRGLSDADRVRWVSLRDRLAGSVRQASLVLLGVVLFVLLIACANVAQLLLSRVSERRQELTIRRALGASRARLVQQLITESMVLTLAAGAAGLAVAQWAARIAAVTAPPPLAAQRYTVLDCPVLAFATGLALLTGLMFGVLPALLIGRMQPTADSLRSHAGSPLRRAGRLRTLLVAAQAALTLVLVAGALTMGRSFLRLLGTDLGFRTERVITLSVSLDGTRYDANHGETGFYRGALDRLRAVPGVESAGAVDYLPLASDYLAVFRFRRDSTHKPWGIQVTATPDYFRTLRTPLLEGRDFTKADRRGAEPVAIVNESFARRAGSAIIGAKIASDQDQTFTVVGVVRTMSFSPFSRPDDEPQVYVPAAQNPPQFATFVVRVKGGPDPYRAVLRDAVQQVDRQVAVYGIETFDSRLRQTLARPRFYTTAILFFGGFALLLAIVGTYGVASYSIAQRTREMGVRIAVGASPRGLRGMLLRQSMLPVACGAVAGVAGAAALGRYLQHLIAQAEPTGPWTCALAAAALAATAALAVWTATGRVVRMDPTAALRAE